MEGDISLSFGVQSAPEKSRRDEREKHEGKAAGTARPRRRRLPGAPPCVFGVGLGRRPEGRGRGLESGQWDVNIIGAALTPNSPKVERNHLTAGQAVGSVSHGPHPGHRRHSRSPLSTESWPPGGLRTLWLTLLTWGHSAACPPELLTLARNDADKPLPGPRPAPLPFPPAQVEFLSEGFCGLSHLVRQNLQLQNHVC